MDIPENFTPTHEARLFGIIPCWFDLESGALVPRPHLLRYLLGPLAGCWQTFNFLRSFCGWPPLGFPVYIGNEIVAAAPEGEEA